MIAGCGFPDDPRFPVLWVEWATKWQQTHPGQGGVRIDPDDPVNLDASDPRYLDAAAPAVRAYLDDLRREGERPSSGRYDDPDELRRRLTGRREQGRPHQSAEPGESR